MSALVGTQNSQTVEKSIPSIVDRDAMGRVTARKPPPIDVIEHQSIRQALERYNAAQADARDAQAAYESLERDGREIAEQQDAEQAADAVQQGAKNPGRANVGKFEKALDAAKHERDTRVILERRSLDALESAVASHGNEWRQQVEQAQRDAEDRFHTALRDLTTSVHDVAGHAALQLWLDGHRYAPGKVAGAVRCDTTDGPRDAREIVSELATMGTPAEPHQLNRGLSRPIPGF